MLERQHFRFGKIEDCFDKLLNHRPLLHVEDFGTFAERLKDAISAVIAHSRSGKNSFFECLFSVTYLLVNDALDVLVNVSPIPSLNHGPRFVFGLMVNEVLALSGWR